LVGLVCSVLLGFDAPRKEDGVQDNPGAKKRQVFSRLNLFFSVDPSLQALNYLTLLILASPSSFR
jgi:hypothetical protein